MNKKAFTVIEVVIYLSISLVFILYMNKFFIEAFRYNKVIQIKEKKVIEKSSIIDLMRRDMSGSITRFVNFKDGFLFRREYLNQRNKEDRKDICFQYLKKEGRDFVARVEGEYDFVTNKWIKKYITIASSITIKEFECIKNKVDLFCCSQ